MDERIEEFLKDALVAEPSVSADAQILAAIRKKKSSWQHTMGFCWRIAACLTILLGLGILFRQSRLFQQREDQRLCEEGEVMLEIIGMASVDEFYAISQPLQESCEEEGDCGTKGRL